MRARLSADTGTLDWMTFENTTATGIAYGQILAFFSRYHAIVVVLTKAVRLGAVQNSNILTQELEQSDFVLDVGGASLSKI